jgi:2'-5' RNA ligase
MGIRSFLAFDLPQEIRGQIGEIFRDVRQSKLPARWVREENIHLTIVFLGSIEESAVEELKESVGQVVKQYTSFTASLSKLGIFPNWRKPRVLWIGLEGNIAGLSRLRDELQEALAVFGIRQETRPFRAHLTLGRFKNRLDDAAELREILERYQDIPSAPCPLDELVLFKSDLKPSGPVYTKMASWHMNIG